ncbi:peptidoglycan DD-metalloendopeptidase family protein [Streptomyces sp. VTCC 41912]|uniref:M23 family metallopeptidase n=1 Tax=Streptomyces sp. VTCC 41912 TaxID=3383243 RepID=UPI003896B19F
MASNRPAPHAPSAYSLGGPADFGGPVGFGGPAGFPVPTTVGDPAGVPAPTAVSGPDDVSAVPAVGGPTDDAAPAGAPQVPSPYGQFPGQRPPGEVFSHDLLTPEPPPQGAPGGAEPSAGPAGADAGDASAGPVRGKHRVAKQRSGGLARGGTVLGVGVIAAVGASGVAAAEDRPPVPISVPDPGGVVDDATGALQDAGPRAADAGAAPVATLAGTDSATEGSAPSVGPAASRPQGDAATAGGAPGAGPAEALRHRILQQADGRPGATEAETGSDADAGPDAARDAGPDAGPADEAAPDAASGTASDAAAEPAAPASPARPVASDDRPADGAGTAVAPVSSYTLTTGFGQAGDRWAADHTGQDFTAPTGTLVRAVHDGTLTQAGWAGGYGYRIVLTLDDGTQLWFCHLSSMVKTTGRVHAGDVIGRVGATGNATTPHLHLEVRPDAGAPTDPLPWLRDRGVTV